MNKNRFVAITILVIICCVFFSGCDKEGGGRSGSIYGTVTDFATGNPVASANVQLLQSGNATVHASITGYDGSFEILDVPSGTYSIKISKDGYSELIDNNPVVVEKGKQTRRDIQIRKQPSSLHLYDNENNEISELDFGADEGVTQKTFNIFNGGSQSLQYVINPIQANWVSVNPNQQAGTVGVGVTYPIIVTINRELLADGNNTTVLTITSASDGGKELTVKARKGGDNSDLVVELPAANLMVQKEDLGCVDRNSAIQLCENSIIAGHNDWRLPSKGELMTLYGNKEFIGGFENNTYWSIDNEANLGSVVVDFTTGAIYYSGSNWENYVRAVRTMNEGSTPTVTTAMPIDVTAQSATCGGEVVSDGNETVTRRGVCYNTSQNPTTSNQCIESGTGTGPFSCNLTGLSPNTKYYVKAFATNSKGTAYGEQKEFTTTAAAPTTFEYAGTTYYVHPEVGEMIWQSAVDYCNNLTYAGYSDWYLPNKDELNAMYVYRNTIGGFNTSGNYSYYWSSTTSDNNSSYAWRQKFYDGTQGTSEKTSYLRVRPVRKDGGGTSLVIPTVTTSTPSSFTTSSAICGGNVTSDGGATVTQRGVCFSTLPNPTTSSQTVSGGSGTGSYTCSLLGLSSNTTYYVRAYAINSEGTGYGEQKSFKTTGGGGGGTATIILTVGDVWGDGSGYQMLLDNTHLLYGTIIPEDGELSSNCSGNESIYAQFSQKIPTNADGNCITSNIVFNKSVSITIPAGKYDWCLANPTPGDRIWIASSQGNVGGRQDDYEFVAGNTYEFTVTLLGQNDATDVVITGGAIGKKSMGQSNVGCRSIIDR